ncbi:MAG: hypothetical protein ACXW4G_12370, partial [Candidatus Deferrimicrobiaceae bacterium]
LRCQHPFLQYRLFPPVRSSDSNAPMLASILPDVSDASFENFNYLWMNAECLIRNAAEQGYGKA